MAWTVFFNERFAAEFASFDSEVKIELRAMVALLQAHGPQLGRPWADTLNGSRFANMKELRFQAAGGVWRAAYAFDPERKAIILVAGDKSGASEHRFYRKLIAIAEERYEAHLKALGKKDG